MYVRTSDRLFLLIMVSLIPGQIGHLITLGPFNRVIVDWFTCRLGPWPREAGTESAHWSTRPIETITVLVKEGVEFISCLKFLGF